MTTAIIGAQWGDEGKGKITDYLASKANLVVRYQGGNNAGHTIYIQEVKYVLHLIPSGILNSDCVCAISHGVVLEPQALINEIKGLESVGVQINPTRLILSPNCHITTQYHLLLDAAREKGSQKIGTTKKGIGPSYEDKISRRGIHLKDLFDKKILKQKLENLLEEKAVLFENLYQIEYPSLEEETQRLYELGQQLFPFSKDLFQVIEEYQDHHKNILLEGAQGVLLDIDYGSYPYVTSSSTALGGVLTGVRGDLRPKRVIGIAKAYTTRVGEGPFPTELHCELGEKIQTLGGEFGATTGRKRRCGWLDLPLLRYAIKASGITEIALTKLDVLQKLSSFKVCDYYLVQDTKYKTFNTELKLEEIEPHYIEFSKFNDDFTADRFSSELKSFLDFLEENLEVKVSMIAFGPQREALKEIYH